MKHWCADALENDEAYVAEKKAQLDGERAKAAAEDDAAHAQKLRDEEEARARAAAAAEEQALAKAQLATEQVEDDGECHIEVKQLKKGDGQTAPSKGDYVHCTYTGTRLLNQILSVARAASHFASPVCTGVFAPGTSHAGKDYSGSQFDSTWDSKLKKHKPLQFQHFGGKAIRGWDEALKSMTLGEKAEVVIGPKWAYRKSGIQDDTGAYIVPPNATLVFQLQLVGVRDAKLQDDSLLWNKKG